MTEPSAARRAVGRARRILGTPHETIARLEDELHVERERITRLEAELDELRRDSLRVAELIDLAEQAFTPKTD